MNSRRNLDAVNRMDRTHYEQHVHFLPTPKQLCKTDEIITKFIKLLQFGNKKARP